MERFMLFFISLYFIKNISNKFNKVIKADSIFISFHFKFSLRDKKNFIIQIRETSLVKYLLRILNKMFSIDFGSEILIMILVKLLADFLDIGDTQFNIIFFSFMIFGLETEKVYVSKLSESSQINFVIQISLIYLAPLQFT